MIVHNRRTGSASPRAPTNVPISTRTHRSPADGPIQGERPFPPAASRRFRPSRSRLQTVGSVSTLIISRAPPHSIWDNLQNNWDDLPFPPAPWIPPPARARRLPTERPERPALLGGLCALARSTPGSVCPPHFARRDPGQAVEAGICAPTALRPPRSGSGGRGRKLYALRASG